MRIQVSPRTVARLLHKLRFSLRVNCKKVGPRHPLREAQFAHIGKLRRRFRRQRNPVISADAKKRELVGNFKNAGAKWDRTPTAVNDHDFRSQSDGIAILYGIYDLHANRGAMFVGVSHETSAFAVASIRTWWQREGSKRYPGKKHLLILADTGGSNSATRGAWKDQLQRFCDHSGLSITVAHYPTGASKYNPIERRLFSMIRLGWRTAEKLPEDPEVHPHHNHHYRAHRAGLSGSQELPRRRKAVCREAASVAPHASQSGSHMELHHRPFKCEVFPAPMLR